MSRSAELMARHLVLASPVKLHPGFDDITRHHFDLVSGSADGKHMDHVGAGHSNPDGNSGRHHYTVRHKKILLRNHPHDHAVLLLSGSQVAFDEFTAEMQSLWVYLVGSVQQMFQARLGLVWKSHCQPHADQRNANQ